MRRRLHAAHLGAMEFSHEDAVALLASFHVGDRVNVVVGGRSNNVTVQRDASRTGNLVVGFGPGRWNATITSAALVHGTALLTSLARSAA